MCRARQKHEPNFRLEVNKLELAGARYFYSRPTSRAESVPRLEVNKNKARFFINDQNETYIVLHGLGQAKFADAGSILGSSQFTLLSSCL